MPRPAGCPCRRQAPSAGRRRCAGNPGRARWRTCPAPMDWNWSISSISTACERRNTSSATVRSPAVIRPIHDAQGEASHHEVVVVRHHDRGGAAPAGAARTCRRRRASTGRSAFPVDGGSGLQGPACLPAGRVRLGDLGQGLQRAPVGELVQSPARLRRLVQEGALDAGGGLDRALVQPAMGHQRRAGQLGFKAAEFPQVPRDLPRCPTRPTRWHPPWAGRARWSCR